MEVQMCNSSKLVMVLTMLLIGFLPAFAEDNSTAKFDYTYIEVQFIHTNFGTDDFIVSAAGTTGVFSDSTSNAFGFEGSLGTKIKDSNVTLYAIGEFMTYDTDLGVAFSGGIVGFGSAPVEFTEWLIGGGVAFEPKSWASLYAQVGYLSTEVEFSAVTGVGTPIGLIGFGLEGQGIDARIGARFLVSDRSELNGYVRYNPHGEVINSSATTIAYEGDLRYSFGYRYRFTDHFSLGARYEFGEPGTLRIGARYSF